MARTHGRSNPDLIDNVLESGPSYSFFQVLRLLTLKCRKEDGAIHSSGLPASRIKIKPNLSLSFPASGVASVTASPKGEFTVLSNLLGLYGTCSPLPTFYTEELMADEGLTEQTVRDVIDVVNHRLYELLFAAWKRNRSMQTIVEEKDAFRLDRFFALIGVTRNSMARELTHPEGLLRYTGLFAMKTRSAVGLQNLLTDAFGRLPVRIIQMVERKGRIGEDQICCLGQNISLGMTSNLGCEVSNMNGAFRIEIGPVRDADYRRFIPGHEDYAMLTTLIRLYLDQPLDYDIDLILDKDEKPKTLCLGGDRFSRLGLDTWVFSDGEPDEFRTRFYPGKEAA